MAPIAIPRRGKRKFLTPENLKRLHSRIRPVTDPNYVEVIGINSKDDYVVIAHRPSPDDAIRIKEEIARQCEEGFSLIQKKYPEMADYELVEPLMTVTVNVWTFLIHLNFKAKPKNGDESSVAVFFAEIDLVFDNVIVCTKIDVDPSAGADCYPRCRYCQPDDGSQHEGCTYHPRDTSTWSGGCYENYMS